MESGIWEPSPHFLLGSPIDVEATGSYKKIGPLVLLDALIIFLNVEGAGGSFVVGSMPFSCADLSLSGTLHSWENIAIPRGYFDMTFRVLETGENSNRMWLQAFGRRNNPTFLSADDFANNSELQMTAWYFTEDK